MKRVFCPMCNQPLIPAEETKSFKERTTKTKLGRFHYGCWEKHPYALTVSMMITDK